MAFDVIDYFLLLFRHNSFSTDCTFRVDFLCFWWFSWLCTFNSPFTICSVLLWTSIAFHCPCGFVHFSRYCWTFANLLFAAFVMFSSFFREFRVVSRGFTCFHCFSGRLALFAWFTSFVTSQVLRSLKHLPPPSLLDPLLVPFWVTFEPGLGPAGIDRDRRVAEKPMNYCRFDGGANYPPTV